MLVINFAVVCPVPRVFAGTTNPVTDTFVPGGSTVTVRCDAGYTSSNLTIATYECESIKSCSSKAYLYAQMILIS
jgi:hypothetical protein